MFDAVIRSGPGVKAPSAYVLMDMLMGDIKKYLQVYIRLVMAKWVEYVCTVILDGWTTPTHMYIINFLVYCDRQTIFVHSICMSSKLHDYKTI